MVKIAASDRNGTTVEGVEVNRIVLSVINKFNRITEGIARLNFDICQNPNKELAVNARGKFVNGDIPLHEKTHVLQYT